MTAKTALHLIVHGRVQGVGYRAWVCRMAEELALHGWVRNRRDDTVEMVIAGDEAVISEMQRRCAQGPTIAKVEKIHATPWHEPVAQEFKRLPTV